MRGGLSREVGYHVRWLMQGGLSHKVGYHARWLT